MQCADRIDCRVFATRALPLESCCALALKAKMSTLSAPSSRARLHLLNIVIAALRLNRPRQGSH